MSLKTIGDVVRSLGQRFGDAGIDEARLDARLIVTHVAGCAPETALVYPEKTLSNEQIETIDQLAQRRLHREPVAYLTGTREFWSLPIGVNQHTLTPRPDTETLVESVIAEIGEDARDRALRILDLGTGSGCILASLLSELPNATGVGIDINVPTIEMARRNAHALALSDRMQIAESNWLDGVDGTFDIVVSNPPYIPAADIDGLEPEVSVYEPRLALDGGCDGLDAYRQIAAGLGGVLKPGGLAAFEFGIGQASDVCRILRENGHGNTRVYSDLSGIERVVLVKNAD